ncbi:MAG: type II secretion system protein [Gemmataceae bacterium]
MTLQRADRERRGFTLIELLVVIAIIAVLVSLTLAGVMRWLGKREDETARKELRTLHEAAAAFKAAFDIYPPSKIVLKPSRSSYGNTPLEIQSLQILDKMFPKLGAFSNIQWVAGLTAAGEVLEGDQCLVFFLAGPNQQGFAKLSAGNGDPTAPKSAVPQRYGPYFEFQTGRLYTRPGRAFPSYMDAYSTSGSTNGAVPYVMFSTGLTARYDSSHAIGAPLSVAPYLSTNAPPRKYHNPDSVQIICAGRDRVFGPGGFWSPKNAEAIAAPGADDMANFHTEFLGVSN